ncbi:MAG: hypothetical protein Q7S51_10290 [Gallionellaceae bacterium]|nr:hypothetical protein [Gallionellaceae bacterium]
MNPKQVIKYQCHNCAQLHDRESQAEDCCPPEADEVTLWECADCDTTYDDQDHARLCCWDGEEPLAPLMAAPAELEAAGQQRLAL